MPSKFKGWIFDVYAEPKSGGAAVWFISEDGKRLHLHRAVPVVFYVGGDPYDLMQLKTLLSERRIQHRFVKRRHLFNGEIEVLAICVQQGAAQRGVFRSLRKQFPNLDYYNADLALPAHFFHQTGTFPTAWCEVEVEDKEILSIRNLDDKWSLDPHLPQLSQMRIEPNCSPVKAKPSSLRVEFEKKTYTLHTKNEISLLRDLNQLLLEHNPDVILTRFGDKWLFPYLLSISHRAGIGFNPNRDKDREPIQIKENQFESYGHLVHRDQQTLLLGRLHLDPQNALGLNDWNLESVYETARLSNLPIQNAARRSTGGAFVGMQVAASLEKGVLIPIYKSQRERFKTANQLVAADNGGVIFKPLIGMHANVAEIDFFSMYPSIMAGWNISAETVGEDGEESRLAPGIEASINLDETGIVAHILLPILEKRSRAKHRLRSTDLSDKQRRYVEAAYGFLKGLGWVSYGYQGFSGNRIGSIEAHEAINALSRDVILLAKEASEDAGMEVLHVYVDSLFAKVQGNQHKLEGLLEAIRHRSGLRVDLAGIFRWVVFLPSKQNQTVPVPNSYYGVFESGEIKSRGIMLRRGDTPQYIKDVQEGAIKILATELNFANMRSHIPELVNFFRMHYKRLKNNQVPLVDLVISQTLSRNLEDFSVISPAGKAALQLTQDSRRVSAGQSVDFVRVRHAPFALSWHLADSDPAPELDIDWYCEQLVRAADELFQPFDVLKDLLAAWLSENPCYWKPQDFVSGIPINLPILNRIYSFAKSLPDSLPHPRLESRGYAR
jgi:DNA polymerase-2